jgi:Uma2 family endonuclease
MGMPQAVQPWTPAMVRALPDDGNRYEVVAGELLVTPAPSFDHQRAVARLFLRLAPYIDTHGLGEAPRPEVLSATLTWRPTPDTPPLEIDLPPLFAEIVED